jgi:hypothetical protein
MSLRKTEKTELKFKIFLVMAEFLDKLSGLGKLRILAA